jgi:hypothetical protein
VEIFQWIGLLLRIMRIVRMYKLFPVLPTSAFEGMGLVAQRPVTCDGIHVSSTAEQERDGIRYITQIDWKKKVVRRLAGFAMLETLKDYCQIHRFQKSAT